VKAKRNDSLDDPDERIIELEVQSSPQSVIEVFSPQGTEELGINMQELLGTLIPKRSEKRQLTVAAARRYLQQEMYAARINMDQVVTEALDRVQQLGVIFIDEIDKIVGSGNASGPDVSREGVQRDILPIVEGAAVTTRYGTVRTDHILFIAAGAFHGSSPSDLIPELQGRFPIRVELEELSSTDLSRILVEPQHSLLKQYEALLSVEGVSLKLAKSAVTEIAAYAEKINSQTENIGARRLQTIMATILEDYLFSPPSSGSTVTITVELVKKKLEPIAKDQDLSKYIL
jgi:ATP-dependent HslUV protease ATP-binding subunit HslU